MEEHGKGETRPAAGTKLIGMTWDHPRAYDSLVAASEAYREKTGVSITWEKRSLQAFADVPIEGLAKAYDLIILDHPHVGQIAESGCLRSLPPMAGDVSLGGSVESYVWKGETWAWPIDAACQMAVVRPDLASEFPRTWDEIMAEGAERFGLLTPLLPVDAFDTMLTLLASMGEEHLPVGESEFCSREGGERALRVLKRLYRLGPGEAVEWNPIRVLEALSETDEFSGSPCLFGYINYARPGFRKNPLLYVDLPVFAMPGWRRSILGGAGIGVSSMRENGDVAQDFAAWVVSEPVQSGVYLENEGQPAHLDTWKRMRTDPRYAGFLDGGFETIRMAWTRPRDHWFLHFVDDICEIFPDFFRKDRDEAAFLSDLNKLYRHHIARDSK
ncbi:extracellular solute-binding protein [Oricola thermophila]|uniref:sn-glycerol-3-phosphate-binding periplasmic protein UgpB n=1 Tax=Oricola thermophila TaxID=2742145 RepID=A0A6N1VHB9_9HYPH|nr:extracellular solute-binding protein [Oricola thermophila]QKV19095.1 extracellular solute-binding protein [Oricola thermophila]